MKPKKSSLNRKIGFETNINFIKPALLKSGFLNSIYPFKNKI